MSASKKATRWGALLGGLALSCSALMVALPANADPGDGGTGTVTVHSFEQTNKDLGPNDGSKLDLTGTSAKPLANVSFNACQLSGFDLKKTTDWNRLKTLTAQGTLNGGVTVLEGTTNVPLTNCQTAIKTNLSGEATFNLNADAVWVVYQSAAETGAVSAAAPSIVTVPYPNSNGTWNYNVHVYPKLVFAGSGATKDSVLVGGKVKYTINVPLYPLYEEGKPAPYAKIQIIDNMTGKILDLNAGIVLKDKNDNSVALTSGTDYTLTVTTGNVTFEMLKPGLDKVNASAINGNLTLTITATPDGPQKLENTAQINVNGGSSSVTDPDPKDVVDNAYFSTVGYNKKAAAGVTTPVAATLEFYAAPAGKEGANCPATVADAQAAKYVYSDFSGDGQGYKTSKSNGQGTKFVVAKGTYCVYETVVPAGYKAPAVEKWVVSDSVSATSGVVKNVQVGSENGDLPALPLTGAAGTALLVSTGVGLLALGGAFYAIGRRRQSNV